MAKFGPEYSAIVDLFLEVDSVVDEFKRKLILPARSLKTSPSNPPSTSRTRSRTNIQRLNLTTSEKEWLGAAACRNPEPSSERRTSISYPSPSAGSFQLTKKLSHVSVSNSGSYDRNLVASRLASIEQFENETRQRLKCSLNFSRHENNHVSFISASHPGLADSQPPFTEPLSEDISLSLLPLENTRLFRDKSVQDTYIQCHDNVRQNSYREQKVCETKERRNAVDELQDAFEELLQEWLSQDLIERCIQQELSE